MKIEYASTPEQEHHISELVDYIYSSIFPIHFSDDYIMKLCELKVLTPKEEDMYYNSTLSKAFHVISSLQALIAVIETVQCEEIKDNHEEIFEKNVNTLSEYGYSFPLKLEEFSCVRAEVFSQFSKPTNHILA